MCLYQKWTPKICSLLFGSSSTASTYFREQICIALRILYVAPHNFYMFSSNYYLLLPVLELYYIQYEWGWQTNVFSFDYGLGLCSYILTNKQNYSKSCSSPLFVFLSKLLLLTTSIYLVLTIIECPRTMFYSVGMGSIN